MTGLGVSLPDRPKNDDDRERVERVLMTRFPWMEVSLEGPIPGCIRFNSYTEGRLSAGFYV